MLAVVVSLVLSQVVVAPGAAPAASSAPASSASPWGRPLEWRQGEGVQRVWVSPVLVAEVGPSLEGAQAVKRVDATAVVVAERAKVRLWRVKDAAQVRAVLPTLVVVVNDLPSTGSRARVPVGLVCGGQRVEASGMEAMERAAKEPGCVPDFWMRGFAR
ncbi:MAG: hypothetical protein IT380_22725 [Myxococcales bacterium]|nr:hypothetical protein [Myxococcales bacterium]